LHNEISHPNFQTNYSFQFLVIEVVTFIVILNHYLSRLKVITLSHVNPAYFNSVYITHYMDCAFACCALNYIQCVRKKHPLHFRL